MCLMSNEDANAVYQLLEKLGHGGMGTVFRAMRSKGTTSTTDASVVVIKFAKDNARAAESLKWEAKMFKTLGQHRNIVKVLDHVDSSNFGFGLVLEPASRDLATRIWENGPLPEREIRNNLAQLFAGLEYCHSLYVLLRDIKPHNLLEMRDGELKLADLGLAHQYHPKNKESMEYCRQVVGTYAYMAPEMLFRRGRAIVLESGDMWAAGCVIVEMATGFLGFFQGYEHHVAGHEKLRPEMRQVMYAICDLLGTPSRRTCGSWLPMDCEALLKDLPPLPGSGLQDYLPDGFPDDLRKIAQGLICYDKAARFTARKVNEAILDWR